MADAKVDPETLILVGAIAGAFGVRGEVRVRSFTADPATIAAYGPLYDKHGALVMTPKSARALKDAVAITAPEVKSREEAEELRGTALYMPRDRLPAADEDEFYHVDLIGCQAEALDGSALGEIVAVHDFGAGDVLEVKSATGAQVFFEFTKAIAPVVDIAARRIIIDPPESAQ